MTSGYWGADAVRALRDALGYERDGLPLVSSHIQDRVDVVQAAVDRLRDIPGFGRRRDDDTPRSWSLPAPPPDDVTVVHVQYESWGPPLRFVRDDNDRWRDADGIPFEWGKLLTNGTVVEGEPPAPEPFDVDSRVRVKASGRTGVVREADPRGRHLIFGDDESWITGLTADRLELVPAPVFERGFYRLTRHLVDLDDDRVLPADSEIALMDGADGEWAVLLRSGSSLVLSEAALAAAGAVRVEDPR